MTLRELASMINEVLPVRLSIGKDALSVECRILDIKQSYGNVRVLIEPVRGSGSVWVDISRLQARDTPPN